MWLLSKPKYVGEGREREKIRKEKNRSDEFEPDQKYKIKKKISKKIKKLKTNILATFQAKISWEWPRKREKKKIIPRSSYPTRNRKFQKNSKKIQKNRKHY